MKICPCSDSQFSDCSAHQLSPDCCKLLSRGEWEPGCQTPHPNIPGVEGFHSQGLPHTRDVLFQGRVCYCLQGHAVGFMEVPGMFCQAVTQITFMEFQNSCKAPESQVIFAGQTQYSQQLAKKVAQPQAFGISRTTEAQYSVPWLHRAFPEFSIRAWLLKSGFVLWRWWLRGTKAEQYFYVMLRMYLLLQHSHKL